MTKVFNMLAQGKAPMNMVQWISTAPVKRDNGFRPVAIGETLLRLGGKIWKRRIRSRAKSYLALRQVGVSVSGGCEAMIHGAGRFHWKYGLDNRYGILQIELANAFKHIYRKSFLKVGRERFPELYPLAAYTYGNPQLPWLWYGNTQWRCTTTV